MSLQRQAMKPLILRQTMAYDTPTITPKASYIIGPKQAIQRLQTASNNFALGPLGSPRRRDPSPRRTSVSTFMFSDSPKQTPSPRRTLHLSKPLRLDEELRVLGIFLPKQTLSMFHHFNPKISKKMETKPE